MSARRRLALRREPLTELTTGDLARVAGAAYAATGLTCPLADCLDVSAEISCYGSCGYSGCCSMEGC